MNDRRFVLRDLPLAARLTLAVFLLAVGLGYVSAMVQLHLQHSRSGSPLPSNDDVIRHFHGPPANESATLLEKLIATTDENASFDAKGTMVPAFFEKSKDWNNETKVVKAKPTAEIRAEREGERRAMLAWIRAGCPRDAYDNDRFKLPEDFGDAPITPAFVAGDDIKIKTLIVRRCVCCHAKDEGNPAAAFPLQTFEQIAKYNSIDRVSLDKLAQTTHAHLLSFAVLFMLTGLLFALTNYPAPLRFVLAPIVLIAQVVDIACWWLARLDGRPGELFALTIPITGTIVGGGLGLQIVLTLFHLFGAVGRVLLVLLFLAAGCVGYVAKDKVVGPFLQQRAEANR